MVCRCWGKMKKPDYSANATAWFPTYKVNLKGKVSHCIIHLFYGLPAEQRTYVLEKLHEVDKEMTKVEANHEQE